ncbi:probable intraflagellar transport protein 172 homolog [Coccomyxa sp. Obi]|nr:probable intraflagellar transport protein 172 homolog [Coccomyxa sp. Obi]
MTGQTTTITSSLGHPITKIDIYQQRFVVAKTPKSLVISNFISNLTGEILWAGSGKERFYFGNPRVCGIYDAGELSIVEFGSSEVLGSCRMRRISPHTISISLHQSDARAKKAYSIVTAFSGGPKKVMWRMMAELALAHGDLEMLALCHEKMGNVDDALQVRQIQVRAQAEGWAAGDVRLAVALAQFSQQWAVAERLLLGQGETGPAVEMYRSLGMVKDAVRVADIAKHPSLQQLINDLVSQFSKEGRFNEAAALLLKQGNVQAAMEYFLEAGMPQQAAQVALDSNISGDEQDIKSRMAHLEAAGLHELVGDLLLRQHRARAYSKAADLAARHEPGTVAELHGEWGGWLVMNGQAEAAVHHFVKAGDSTAAVEAALSAGHFETAAAILDKEDVRAAAQLYRRLAAGYEASRQLDAAEGYYIKAGLPVEAAQMWLRAKQWARAVHVASQHLPDTAAHELFVGHARALEAQKRWKDAESAWVAAGDPGQAVAMHRRNGDLAAMFRAVSQHQPECLADTHVGMAQELEAAGDFKGAEAHFVEAGQWQAAADMYARSASWEDALRVAKAHGGTAAHDQVAIAWASSCTPEEAVTILARLDLLEAAIDAALNANNFQHAFDVAAAAVPALLPEVHLRHAIFLEDKGQCKDAEQEFLLAGQPKKAIDMWLHQKNWLAARRVCQAHHPSSLASVVEAQARSAQEEGDVAHAEALYLEIGQSELALEMHQELGDWNAALRFAEQHLPHKATPPCLAA